MEHESNGDGNKTPSLPEYLMKLKNTWKIS